MFIVRIVRNDADRIKNTFSADHFRAYAREIVIVQSGVKEYVHLGSGDFVFIMNGETGKTIDKWTAPIDPDDPKPVIGSSED